MAKFLLVCARGEAPLPADRIGRACELLAGAGLDPRPPEVRSLPGLALAVSNPGPTLALEGTSLCLGQMFGPRERWWEPGAPIPDGSFALVRSDERIVELATDAVASRSVFHALEGDLFVASSSQRALLAVLGGFRLQPEAVSWMISAGTLGPFTGWDGRIARLGADARLRLDRDAWQLTTRSSPIVFGPARRPDEEHADRLQSAVQEVCDDVDLSGAEWRLPLSGGYDSRALLLFLAPRHPIRCVTWGATASLEDPLNDAHVARELAGVLGVPHEFFPMDGEHRAPEVLLDRFLANGDGCVDHIGGYTDGFETWLQLAASGVHGVLRGDEGCGWEQVVLDADVRRVVGARMLHDFWPQERIAALGLAEQRWPEDLAQQGGETPATWRDRLYHSWRIPNVLAALTDLKAPYVEVVNPLLSRRILEVVRAFPDRLRTEKQLFRRVVAGLSPPVPFATRSAIPRLRRLVSGDGFVDLARNEIAMGREEGSLPAAFADELVRRLPAPGAPVPPERSEGTAGRLRVAVRDALPRVVHSTLRAVRPRPPSLAKLAFRAAIVARMARTLGADARALDGARRP